MHVSYMLSYDELPIRKCYNKCYTRKLTNKYDLRVFNLLARVAELVDARDLKSLEGNLVPVRLRPWAD